MFDVNTLICLYLQNPREKFWGRLYQYDERGIQLIGIELNSFDAWCRELSGREESAIFPNKLFIPAWRIEKIILDESQGLFLSFADQFRQKTDQDIALYFPLV